MGALGGGDRIFPGRGAGSGGGGGTGGPFAATIEGSSNASNVSVLEGQYTKANKVVTAIVSIELDVNSAGSTRVDIGIPIEADGSLVLAGSANLPVNAAISPVIYQIDQFTYRVSFTSPSAYTGINLIMSIQYKSVS